MLAVYLSRLTVCLSGLAVCLNMFRVYLSSLTVGTLDVKLTFEPVVAEWRNWQTHQTQNLAKFTLRVGSTPTSATNLFRSLMENWPSTRQ
jgi:hypothetical protein